MTDELFEGC